MIKVDTDTLQQVEQTLDVADVRRYEPYTSYKPSGVEWLGDVPEHWEANRLKYVASINDESLSESTSPSFEFKYIDIGNVDSIKGIIAVEPMAFENAPSRARRIVRNGDTIVSTVRTYLRAIAPIRDNIENLIVSTGFAVIRPRKVDPAYISYGLRSEYFIETIVSRSTGVSYPAINSSEVADIFIPLPDATEQKAIARFLDEQTRKIDDLIESKRKLLDLLKEKRQAIITHAVTKGINPDVKLKSSGIEWLGDIPEHWEVKRIKHLGHIRYGLGEPPEYVDDGLPFIRATDIYRGKINASEVKRVSPSDLPFSRNPILRKGEILVVRSGAYTGDSAIVSSEIEGSVAGYDMVFRTIKGMPEFIAYSLLGKHLLEGQIYLLKHRAAQPHLNAEELGNCLIAAPPIKEQTEIADYLHERIQEIDSLVSTINKAIERLTEYRTALISAVVTGKIDVRGRVS